MHKTSIRCYQKGGTDPVVLNVANDMVVDLFLNDRIKFINISQIIDLAIKDHTYVKNPNLDDIDNVSKETKKFVNNLIIKGSI